MNINKKTIQKLLKKLDSTNAGIREEATLELARIGSESTLEELSKKLLIEDEPDVKKMIIYALGEIGSEKAISTLSECSKADDFEMRWVAVEALGKIPDLKASKILINCLNNESVGSVRAAIIKSLANFNFPEVIKTLLFCLDNDEDLSLHQETLLSLNKLAITKDLGKIIGLCQSISQENIANNNCPKVLVDASLILDVLLERNSIFLDKANAIINLVLSNSLNGYIAEMGLQDIWEISKNSKGQEYASYLVIKLLNSFNVCKIDSDIIEKAREYHLNSLETGIQVECAKNNNLDAIITLRAKDFWECGWGNVFSPSQFLESYNSGKQFKKDEGSAIESVKYQLNQTLNNSQEPEEILSFENKLLLFQGWKIEHFDLLCSKNNLASASIVLFNTQSKIRQSESAFGTGAIATLFTALDRAISHIVDRPQHILESIKVSNLEEGIEASVSAVVVVKSENTNKVGKVRKFHIHRNLVKACFYAYVKAVIDVYNLDCDFDDKDVGEEVSNISKMSISEKDISKLYKSGERDFSKINLREANLVEANFSGIDLRISDLSLSNLQGINLSKANLTEAVLTKVIVSEADLNEAILCRAKLDQAILKNSKLTQADLTKADLTESYLTKANLLRADLTKADLTKADLTDAKLLGADLTGANLTNAKLLRADLTGANLTNAKLLGADLTGADLTNANLSSANLTGVNLTTTTIDGANLSEANLSQADLRGLDLNKTVFCKPILTDTAMPEIKIEIYGYKRIERMIQLFNQFDSDHYVIYAVHSSTFGCWWNSDFGQKFRQVNKELRSKGISIKRVFIVPKDNSSNEINEILEEQANFGIEVRCLSEDLAKSLYGFDLRKTNLLVCKNLSVRENSFTTMMLVNEKQQEESGYISYKRDDIEINEKRFTTLWENAIPLHSYEVTLPYLRH